MIVDILVVLYLICALFTYIGISWSNNDRPNYATYALMALGWPLALIVGMLVDKRHVE